jgi:hypothetical protein
MISDNSVVAPLVNSFGDQYFHDVNGTAFNKVGSEALYQKNFREKITQENQLFIVMGTDSGLLPKYIQRLGVPDGTRFIFVELPEILERFENMKPDGEFEDRIFITTPENWFECANNNGFQNYVFLRRFEFLESIGAQDLHMPGYQEACRNLQGELEQLSCKILTNLGSEAFYTRQMENLADNMHSAACLKNTFQGKTAVILGGGPSLDKSLDWITSHRSDLVVIAVSRVARRLLEVGLVPDIIISVDPQDVSFDVSKDMLLFWEKTLFVYSYHVSSKLIAQWRGRSLYLGPRLGWASPWNDEQMPGMGPTVTNTAIGVATEMGFTRLLLTGVDLCFSREGFTHARGSNEHQAGPHLGAGKLWVETNGGWLVETRPDYHFAISTIADQAAAAKEKNCKLINLNEDAAVIPGVDFCPSDSIILEQQTQSAFETLAGLLPDDTSSSREKFLNTMITELDNAEKACREIKDLAKEALNTNKKFSGTGGKQKGNPKYRKKLDRIEKKLNSDYIDFTRLLKHIGLRNFLTVAYSDWDKDWKEEDVERLMRQYYETYRDGAEKLLDMISKTRDRLLFRLEEEKDEPDFNRLLDQWEKDGQPGRSLVWKTRHANHTIPETFNERFSSLEKNFEAIIEQTPTLLAMLKVVSQLGPVCGKLNLMFRRREKDQLENMLVGLKEIESQDAKVLFHLGTGYLAELTGDTGAAVQAYHLIIDKLLEKQSGSVLETALLRVFAISLENRDTENALLAANCLAGLSPAYLPYYADICRLAGDKLGALDVYAEYLEKVNADIAVMLKMGQLYSELGVMDGAKLMFESILEEDPGNKAASKLLSDLEGGTA